MPTYEYQCLNCNINFEAFQKMSDEALKECPQCHGKVKRLISSGAGIIFKGKGFYVTDYKKSSASDAKTEVNPVKESPPFNGINAPCSGCDQSACKEKNKE